MTSLSSASKAMLDGQVILLSDIHLIFKIILIMTTVNWKDGLQTSTCRSRCGCRASSTRSPSSPPSCRSSPSSPSSKLSSLSSVVVTSFMITISIIMQSTARKNELPLDKMCLVCDVTKKMTRCSNFQPPTSSLSSSPPPSSLSPSSCPHHQQQSSMTIRHLHLADLCPAVSFLM